LRFVVGGPRLLFCPLQLITPKVEVAGEAPNES
jgi:hypothetical protein